MKRLLALFVLLIASQAQAVEAPAVIGLHLHSIHFSDLHWNNNNPGIYARWSDGFTVGGYKNSLWRQSYYAGWTFSDAVDRFAVTVGAVSGYDKLVEGEGDHRTVRCDKEHGCRMVELKSVILPMLVPSVRIGVTDRFSARVSFLIPPGSPKVLHLSVEWLLR